MEMEKTFKNLDFNISYQKITRNTVVTVEKKAGLHFGGETTFSEIKRFMEEVNKVFSGYKFCAKNGLHCKVHLSIGIYERGEKAGDLKQLDFDDWLFEGTPDECEGLYLRPDTRYTNEEHDIYIDFAEPLLDQLAQANI